MLGAEVVVTKGCGQAYQRRWRRMAERGQALRWAPGIYVRREEYEQLCREHREIVRAVAASHHTGGVLVGRSALQVWGLPMARWREGRPELGFAAWSAEGRVRPHRMSVEEQRCVVDVPGWWGTVRTVTPLLACVQAACWHGALEGLVPLENCLYGGATSYGELHDAVAMMRGKTGVGEAKVMLALASEWSQSPQETVTKWHLHHAGLPSPWQQRTLRDGRGSFIARPDFFWPDARLAVEYDGEGKMLGEYGVSPAEFCASDVRRMRRLATAGIRVMHLGRGDHIEVTYADIVDAYRHRLRTEQPFPASRMAGGGLAWR